MQSDSKNGGGLPFEHAQDGDAKHTLVVFDRLAGLPEATPPTLRLHRSDITESLDAITHFSEQRQAVADSVAVASGQAEHVEALSATLAGEAAGPH